MAITARRATMTPPPRGGWDVRSAAKGQQRRWTLNRFLDSATAWRATGSTAAVSSSGGAALGLGAPALAALLGARRTAAQDQTTVNFLHSIPPETEQFWRDNLLPAFLDANPGCLIEAQNYGTENPTTIRTRVQAGGDGAPTMAWLASAEQGVYTQAELLADVPAFLDERPQLRDNIIPLILDVSSYDGAVRTLPWTTNNLAIWVNVDAFEEAGVPIPSKNPEETWTWEEFAAAAAATTKGDERKGFLMTFGSGWDTWAFHAWLAQAGGTFLQEDGTPGFASAEGVEAMTFLKSLVDAGATAFSEPGQGADAGAWYSGRVAMTLNGPWNAPALREFDDFRFDVVPYPRNVQPATNLGGNQLYIFNTGSEAAIDCAFSYGEYMLSDDFQVRFTIQDGSFPVTESATASEEFQAHLEEYPWLLGWANQTPYGVVRSSLPQYEDVSQVFSNAYDEIMVNDAPIEETLQNAAEEAESFKE